MGLGGADAFIEVKGGFLPQKGPLAGSDRQRSVSLWVSQPSLPLNNSSDNTSSESAFLDFGGIPTQLLAPAHSSRAVAPSPGFIIGTILNTAQGSYELSFLKLWISFCDQDQDG
jgi:hypothetical protein